MTAVWVRRLTVSEMEGPQALLQWGSRGVTAGAPTAGAPQDVHTGFLVMDIGKNKVCQKITSPLLGPRNLTELMGSL